MGNKKDIGTIFEGKLKQGEKQPSGDVWRKIDTTLGREGKNKNLIYYKTLIGLGILGILLLLFYNSEIFKADTSSQERSINSPVLENIPAPINKEKEAINSLNGSPIQDTLKTISVQGNISNSNLNHKGPKESSTKKAGSAINLKKPLLIKNNQKNKAEEDPFHSDDFTITKKYYYYNSKTNKTIVTTNKNKIDSLIKQENKFSEDSLRASEIDSSKR